jgi:hypothetical protein
MESNEKVDETVVYPAQSPGSTPEVVTATMTVDFGAVLLGMLKEPGRVSFKGVIESGRMVEFSRIQSAAPENGYRSMRDAATYLRHGYHWLSRNWKKLGLNPKKVGKPYFFAQDDLDACIQRQRGPRVGKRAKVVRVVSN